jgi:hypothetical protein
MGKKEDKVFVAVSKPQLPFNLGLKLGWINLW